MKRTAHLLFVLAALLVAGCATPYVTPIISDIDDNDLKIVVKTNDRKVTVEGMEAEAAIEARRGCGRWNRKPEYLSHMVLQDWWTFGEALAEGLKPVWAQERAPTEKIVQFLYLCRDRGLVDELLD